MMFSNTRSLVRIARSSFLLVVVAYCWLSLSATGDPGEIRVSQDGSGDYSLIQDAIGNASSGDTILIAGGMYRENIYINESIELRGEGSGTTIIEGVSDYRNATITVLARDVVITGIEVTRHAGGGGRTGIFIQGDGFRMESCTVRDHDHGMHIAGSTGTSLLNNTMTGYRDTGFLGEGITDSYIGYNSFRPGSLGSPRDILLRRAFGNLVENNTMDNLVGSRHGGGPVPGEKGGTKIAMTAVGCLLDNSGENHLSANAFHGSGLGLNGDPDMLGSNTVSLSNTVNGKEILFLSRETGHSFTGEYGQIILIGCRSITLDGVWCSLTSDGIIIMGCEEVLVRDPVSSGNINGISILRSSMIIVEGANCTGNTGDGIHVHLGSGITIRHSWFTSNRNGVQILQSNQTTVTDNRCSRNTRDGIRSEDSDRLLLARNLYANNSEDGLTLIGVTLSQIFGNQGTGNGKNGMDIYHSSNIDIEGDHHQSNGRSGIYGWNVSNVLIKDTLSMGNSWHGIWLYSSSLVWLMDNRVLENHMTGVRIASCSDMVISGNIVTDNSGSWASGIWLDHSDDLTIRDNMFSLNRVSGMAIFHSNSLTITGNNCSANGIGGPDGKGIHLYRSNLNTITDNVCSDNTGWGIYLEEYSTFNDIRTNTIRDNRLGIETTGYAKFNAVNENEILGNREFGIIAENIGDHTLNATGNWWGTDTGPYNGTLNNWGRGDEVAGNVLFRPWANRSPTIGIISPENHRVVNGVVQVTGSAGDSDSYRLTIELRILDGPWMDITILERESQPPDETRGAFLVNDFPHWNYTLDTTLHPNGQVVLFFRAYDGNSHSGVVMVLLEVLNRPSPEEMPDLRVPDITVDPEGPYTGSQALINIELMSINHGSTVQAAYQLYSVYLGDPRNRSWLSGGIVWFTNEFSVVQVPVEWTVPETPGMYLLGVSVEYTKDLPESDYLNNNREIEVNVLASRDLYAVGIQLPATEVTVRTRYHSTEFMVWNLGDRVDNYHVSATITTMALPGWEVWLDDASILRLEPKMQRPVLLHLVWNASAPPSSSDMNITIVVRSESRSYVSSCAVIGVRFREPGEDRWLPPLPDTPILIVLAGIGISILAFATLTEVGKIAFLSMLVPLLSRLHRGKILEDFNRGRIMGYIESNPGSSFTEILKTLDFPSGTLTYHLIILERERFITSKKEGIYKLFYPRMRSGEGPAEENNRYFSSGYFGKTFRPSQLQASIMKVIRENPGITQHDIAEEMQVTKQTLNYHIKMLRRRGLIKVAKVRKFTHCYINEKYTSTE